MLSDWKWILQFLLLLILFIGIVFGAYYVTKWIGMAQFRKYQGKNIRVVESIGIGQQKALQLIQVGTKFFLIGTTKDRIIFMTEIDQTTLEFPTEEDQYSSFQSYLNQWLSKKGCRSC